MTTPDIDALLPCPFCGGEAQMIANPLDERFGYATQYVARCPKCPAKICATDKSNPKGGYALSTGKAEAIAAWNHRTPAPTTSSPDIDALREAARTALEGATPGEWRAGNECISGTVAIWRGDDMVAQAGGRRISADESRADAAAIVAVVNYCRADGLDEARALAAFKAYTHRRLDDAGVATHPEGEHSAAGCRVGDRFDLLIGERDTLAAEVARLREALQPFADCCDQIGEEETAQDWAKFRLLVSHYRAAHAALAVEP